MMDGPITEAAKLREERDAALERVAELDKLRETLCDFINYLMVERRA